MQIKNKKGISAVLTLAAVLAVALVTVPAASVSAAGTGDILWKDSFGGSSIDYFSGVTATSDGGSVAVGYSLQDSFGNGDWDSVQWKGRDDAIIVKYDADGVVEWKYNFGGLGPDQFHGVAATSDGFVAVGYSAIGSFGNNDWGGISGKGRQDATIVKFKADGTLDWAKNFGGSGDDYFYGVTATSDSGFVAVGYLDSSSFGNGDLTGIPRKGNYDAIIVKFDADGGIEWAKNFGGSYNDYFYGVTEPSDGVFVAVGYSYGGSFGNGDLDIIPGKGGYDAIIVEYDIYGDVVWKKNFGGSGNDGLYNVEATPDNGFVAVGYSGAGSFGNNDWPGASRRGSDDATIVKFNADGTVAWNKNFGGSGVDEFRGVAVTSDGGFVTSGYLNVASFGNGDLIDNPGKGGVDAIVVKYNANGVADWIETHGGPNADFFTAITATSDGGFVAVGYSYGPSFGNGDWADIQAKGSYDGTIIKYRTFIPVTDISGGFSSATVGKPLSLTGTVTPSDATYKTITWSVKDAGTTGAKITKNVLSATGAGAVVLTATIDNGLAMGTPFTKDFKIYVTAASSFVPVTDITLGTTSMTAGTSVPLNGTVMPSNATHKDIVWSIASNGSTGASINGSTLSATGWGTVVVTATIADGKAAGTPFTKNFTISVAEPRNDDVVPNDDPDNDTNSNMLLWAAVAAAVIVACMVIAAIWSRRRNAD